MFAVKGWSVKASALKPQVDLIDIPTGAKNEQTSSKKSGRKRKRENSEAKHGPDTSSNNVGELWEKYVEKKQQPRLSKQEPVQEKKLEPIRGRKSAVGGLQNASQAIESEKDRLRTKGKKKRRREWVQEEPRQHQANGNHDLAEVTDVVDTLEKRAAARQDSPLPKTTKLTPMQSAMRQKLVSARFRHLNQTLYTEPSTSAQNLFDQNPDMFEDYHAGFRQQVSVWPQNPVDSFIDTVRRRGKAKAPKIFKDKRREFAQPERSHQKVMHNDVALPRTHGTCIMADLGCGDASLAQKLKKSGEMTTLNLKLFSYDLHAQSSLVTKADISNLPLAADSVNVAILCLALMGTNWISFVEEAFRVLHWKGELWIAEIKSRFGRVGRAGKPVDHSVGGKRKQAALKKALEVKQREKEEVDEQDTLQTEVDGVVSTTEETDVSAFVEVLKRRGFILKEGQKSIDLDNKMFVKMEFIKAVMPTKGKGVLQATETGVAKAKKKFIVDEGEDPATEDEAKVLKPCLYRVR